MTLDAGIRKYKEAATFIVAASDSLHKERADYVCSGVNDDVTIQQAIDGLPTGGGKVLLLEGTYNISTSITIMSDDIVLEGVGHSAIIKPITGANLDEIIKIGSSVCLYRIELRNFTIDGNKANQTGGVGYGIYIVDYYNFDCRLDNIFLKNTRNYCIKTFLTEKLQINNCFFLDSDGGGFSGLIDKDLKITNTICEDAAAGLASLNILGCDGAIVNGCSCYGGGDGIKIQKAGVTSAKFVTISNCNFKDVNRHSIQVSHVDYCNIIGCVSENPTLEHYCVEQVTRHISIIGNTGYNASNYGIWVGGDTEYVTVIGNTIDTTISTGIGIIYEPTYGAVKHVIVKGNIIYSAGRHGIELTGAEYSTVEGNEIIDAGQSVDNFYEGIYLHSLTTHHSTNNKIINNIIYATAANKPRYGIKEEDANQDHNEFAGNHIEGVSTGAMDILGPHSIFHKQYSDLFMDVLAVSATHVVNAQACHVDPTTLTVGAGIAAQPDVPRTLSWVVNNAGGITAADITITGIDAKGNSITESFDLTGGLTGETNNAFATVSEVKIENQVNAAAGDTISVGITDVLGLSNIIYATGDVFKIKKNNADEVVAVAEVNTTYDTYDMGVIGLAGGDDFTIWFKSNLNIIS